MSTINVHIRVPNGDYCNYRDGTVKNGKKCKMLVANYNYCRLFDTKLKLAWHAVEGKETAITPFKCLACMQAEVQE